MPTRLSIIDTDPTLYPYEEALWGRLRQYRQARKRLLAPGQTLADFANGHLYFGFHRQDGGWVFREWAPEARAIFLMGDFNDWKRQSHPLRAVGGGVWEVEVTGEVPHGAKVRLLVETGRETLERIPAYTRRAVQNPRTLAFDGQVWLPPAPYPWQDGGHRHHLRQPPLIYESHVGMSGEEPRVAGYAEYAERVLPRVRRLGYNAIQLMAI